jgi:hypothetical protein
VRRISPQQRWALRALADTDGNWTRRQVEEEIGRPHRRGQALNGGFCTALGHERDPARWGPAGLAARGYVEQLRRVVNGAQVTRWRITGSGRAALAAAEAAEGAPLRCRSTNSSASWPSSASRDELDEGMGLLLARL